MKSYQNFKLQIYHYYRVKLKVTNVILTKKEKKEDDIKSVMF